MSDSPIHELDEATSLGTADLLVLEQSGAAKKITGATLIAALAGLLDGHGGISSITYTAPAAGSLTGTLTINYADGSTPTTLTITNGRGISSLSWAESGTAGDGRSHVGTFTYNDGTSSTVTIQDGLKGNTGAQTFVWIKWSDGQPTSDNDMLNSPASYIGIYVGLSSTAPTAYTSYQWYQYKGAKGDQGDSIASVTRTSGTGAQGSTDVYSVILDNGNTAGTITIYQGRDGTGAVDSVNGVSPASGSTNLVLTANDLYLSSDPTDGVQADVNEIVAQHQSAIGNVRFYSYALPGGSYFRMYFDTDGLSRCIVHCIGNSAGLNAILHVNCSTAGNVGVNEMVSGASLTINTATSARLQIKNTASSSALVFVILASGAVNSITVTS